MAKFLDDTGLATFWAKIKSLVTGSIQALDVSSVGGSGKYISAISETDGKISATATTMDTTPTANSTKAVTSGGIKTALDGKVNKSGDKMTGPLQGFLLSACDTTVGNEYNVLLNAKERGILTFTQSGSGQLTEAQVWNLFDGKIAPQYGPAIDPEDPYILELDLSSYIGGSDHCQVYSAFGWTCRYWEPLRFKVELYNTYQSANEWVTICDYSQANYTGQYSGGGTANLFVKFGSGTVNPHTGVTKGGVFRKIRITIWKGNESTNRWGISEIFFWYPEKSAVYEGLAAFSATKLKTAYNLCVNLENDSTNTPFDGTGPVNNIRIAGALPVTHGGTGKNTAKAAEYNLTTGKSEISDTTSGDDRVVFELASPSESNGVTRGFRKLSTIWTWIKGLLSSESGVNISGSSASCTGNAATATAFSSGTAKTKFDGIAEGATKVEASATPGDGTIKINGASTTVYTHPSTTAAAASAKKVGKDALGHVVLGDALAKGDVGLGNVNNTAISVSATNGVTDSTNNVTYKYTHPTSSGNKHVPSGGSSGQFLGWSADGTAAWSDLPKDYTTLNPSSETIRAYKRYTIGKTNVNLSSANSVRATALIRIHVNYNDELANSQVAEGMLITMLANICFRTGSLAEMRLDIIGESRWDYSKIRPVLVSFGITEGGITKYVIAIGLGDGTNGTTLQAFDYSYIDVMPLCSNAGWDWMNEGDAVGTYDYIAQAVRETGARLGTAVGSSSLPVYVNDKGEFAAVTASSTATKLLCALPAWTATPTDSTYLVRRDTGGAASYGQVTFETVWNYIKGKMSSDPSGVLNGRVSGFTSNIWGTGAKRISLGYANMSATDAWYNAIFLLKTGYNATIGDGRSIALMISYCHRSTGRRVSARVLVNNGWPLSLIPGVFTLETDNNTKLVVGVGVRDSNNDFVNLQYSEFNVVVLGKEESWTDNVTSDSVNACDHWFPTAQQPDIVVVDELPSSPDSNKIYFV